MKVVLSLIIVGNFYNRYHILSLVILLLFSFPLPTFADNDGVENEIGEELGSVAIVLLVIGSLYVILRRLVVWSKSWDDSYKEEKDQLFQIYRRFRQPLLLVHNFTLIAATIIAGIHGVLLLDQEFSDSITGIIAWLIMMILSIFGFVIYFRLRPIWSNREVKGFVRFIHRQWILSVLLIVFLAIHAA